MYKIIHSSDLVYTRRYPIIPCLLSVCFDDAMHEIQSSWIYSFSNSNGNAMQPFIKYWFEAYLPGIMNQNKEDKRHGMTGYSVRCRPIRNFQFSDKYSFRNMESTFICRALIELASSVFCWQSGNVIVMNRHHGLLLTLLFSFICIKLPYPIKPNG